MRILSHLVGSIASLSLVIYLVHDLPVDLDDFSRNRTIVPVIGLAIASFEIVDLLFLPSVFGAYKDAQISWLPHPSSVLTCFITGLAWPPIVYGIWWMLAPSKLIGFMSVICALLTLAAVYYLTAIGPLRIGSRKESK